MFYYSYSQFALKTLWPALHSEISRAHLLKKKKDMDIGNSLNSILVHVNADDLLKFYTAVLLC